MNDKPLPEEVIEAKALEVLRETGQRALPIDLAAITAAHSILLQEMPKNVAGTSGALLKQGDVFAVVYNTAIENEGFQRFSIAHELGHYFLPGHSVALLSNHQLHISDGHGIYEKEADQFAACLLMPKRLLGKRVTKAQPTLEYITSIAALCDVSIEAAALRVLSLNRNPMAVARVDNGVVEYCMMSRTFKQIRGLAWIKGGSPCPAASNAMHFSRDAQKVADGMSETSQSCVSEWFNADYELELEEVALGLGSYGKTLVLMTCESEDDREEDNARQKEVESRGAIKWK